MQKILTIMLFPVFVYSMDKPTKPVDLVDLGSSVFTAAEFKKILNTGMQVSSKDLEGFLDLVKKGYTYFWDAHGVEFLLKATLAPAQTAQQGGAPAKESKIKLPEQAQQSLAKTYKDQLKELMGIAIVEKSKPLISHKIDENSVKKLWAEFLNIANTPIALDVLKDIRQSYLDADKQEPAIVNFMIDELVKKICANLLEITDYLKNKRELDDLVKGLKKNYASEIKSLKQQGDDSYVKQNLEIQRVLFGMLTANKLSCPIFVKEQVLKITEPKKGFFASVKSMFTP